MKDKKEMKSMAAGLEPVVRIGKSGLRDTVVEEIKKHLKQKGLIKVKMLKTFVGTGDKQKLAEELAEKAGALLVQRIGSVVVLARKQ